MAKRVKIDDVFGNGVAPNVQKLVTSHEAERLVELSNKLKTLAENQQLSPWEREREYEDCLEEFRRVQETVLQQGIRMQPTTEKPSSLAEDRIRKAVREELAAIMSTKLPTAPESNDAASKHPPESNTRCPKGTTGTKSSSGNNHSWRTNKKSEGTSNRNTPTRLKNSVQHVSGKVIFNHDHWNDKMLDNIFKPNPHGYAESTYKKAVNYLFGSDYRPMPAQTGMDVIVYNIIRGLASKKDFTKMLQKFPNLKNASEHFNDLETGKAWIEIK